MEPLVVGAGLAVEVASEVENVLTAEEAQKAEGHVWLGGHRRLR